MRGILASSIGVACATALVLPLAQPAAAAPAEPASPAAPVAEVLPGHTQSLPLAPLAGERVGPGLRYQGGRRTAPTTDRGLPERTVRPFSLVGVVWDDPDAELRGSVQVRVRPAGGTSWSGWQDVETHNHEHAADPEADESDTGRTRGSTAPLWVGRSDGVQVRVRAEILWTADVRDGGTPTHAALPGGLRIDLVDPGADEQAARPAAVDPAAAGRPATPRPATPRPATPRPAVAHAVPA
ncbi:N-acetylmuramoyl-L-alanine amidase, partial [Streptomyces sp. NPDC060194]